MIVSQGTKHERAVAKILRFTQKRSDEMREITLMLIYTQGYEMDCNYVCILCFTHCFL